MLEKPAAEREVAPPRCLTMVVLLVRAALLVLLLQYSLLLTWKSRSGADFETETNGLTEAQAREIITKLRQRIGPYLDPSIAPVGAARKYGKQ